MRQESDEMEFIRRQAARREAGDERAWAGHGFDAETGGDGGFHHAFTRIADAGTAGVRDQRDLLPAPEPFDDLLAAFGLVELKIAQERLADAEMFQQLPGMPRVLGGNHVALAQDTKRAERDVLQVANPRGHEAKRAGGERWPRSGPRLTSTRIW